MKNIAFKKNQIRGGQYVSPRIMSLEACPEGVLCSSIDVPGDGMEGFEENTDKFPGWGGL